jgi:hypothetical protein
MKLGPTSPPRRSHPAGRCGRAAGVVRELASVTVTAVAHGRHLAEPGAIPGKWRPSSVAVTLRDASSRVTHPGKPRPDRPASQCHPRNTLGWILPPNDSTTLSRPPLEPAVSLVVTHSWKGSGGRRMSSIGFPLTSCRRVAVSRRRSCSDSGPTRVSCSWARRRARPGLRRGRRARRCERRSRGVGARWHRPA